MSTTYVQDMYQIELLKDKIDREKAKEESKKQSLIEAIVFGKPFQISEDALINILTKESSLGSINTISIQKSNNEYWVVFDNKKIGE